MRRREFLAVALGLLALPSAAANAQVEPDVRLRKVWRFERPTLRWKRVRMLQLRKDDIFRLEDGGGPLRALVDAYRDGEGMAVVNAVPVGRFS